MQNKPIGVLIEYNFNDKSNDVIGVVDSIKSSFDLIDDYYGEHDLVQHFYIGENIEYQRVIICDGDKLQISLHWHSLNSL